MSRALRVRAKTFKARRRYSQAIPPQGQDDKLRILFCGTDLFSVKHLEALREYKDSGKSNISSIDVVTKTDRRAGRGLKKIKAPAIKEVALRQGLRLHQIETFTGWTPPEINLIVAVSFGLLIPPRIIRSSKYGGLNVHPSLLPDLRGAAPIAWAIAYGRRHTGVSIQTLHETKFDHGIVLDQSDKIELPESPTWPPLLNQLADTGAQMLVNALQHRLYLSPHQTIPENAGDSAPAPKIRDEHKLVDFHSMTSGEIDRKSRAFGPLHAFVKMGDQKLRLVFEPSNLHAESPEKALGPETTIPVGVPYARLLSCENFLDDSQRDLRVNTVDGKSIVISRITIEGKPRGPAVQAAARAHLFKEGVGLGDHVLHQFKVPLTAT